MSKVQLSGLAVLLIVAMRLAAGCHFFSEGLHKLEPGWSSEGFLRRAKGPLADYFHSFAPGPHGVYELLAQPRKWGEELEETGEEDEGPFPAGAPYHDWATRIDRDWQLQHDAAMVALNAGDEIKTKADKAYRNAQKMLGEYLAANQEAIAENQHELWRLEQMKQGYTPEEGALPYLDDRIAAKEREVRSRLVQWINGVQAIEDDFHEGLSSLASESQRESSGVMKRLDSAFHPSTPLDRVNTVVTWVVLGSGALLFVGLFTRVAAVVAAGFLCSVIATQPPWVYGADTTYFYYQLFEIIGLLTLAVVGAGRWLGVDALLWRGRQTEPQE